MIEIDEILSVKEYISDISLVIFDLDDTLYGEKDYVKSGYKEVAKILPQIENAYEKLYAAFEEKKSVFDEVLSSEGIYSDDLKNMCLKTYRFQKPDITLYPGVKELLVNIRSSGRKIGIITDGRPEGQWAKLKTLELDKLVDYIVVTDELGGVEFRKPCDKAFVLMKEKFGFPYEEICYIGDNIKKDFIAPDRLGMRSIWFKNRDGLYFGQ